MPRQVVVSLPEFIVVSDPILASSGFRRIGPRSNTRPHLKESKSGKTTLDRLFLGALGIGPDPFQLVYDQLMKRNP